LIILGKYEECIRYCNRALALNPQDASELYFIKAECFKKMKRYREALENYIKAVEIRKRVFYLIPLAILLYDMEEYDKALEIFDTLEALDLKYNDDLESIFLYKGKIMEKKGRFKEAIDYFDKALEVNPANAEIYDKKASSLYYLGRDTDDMDLIKESIIYYRLHSLNGIAVSLEVLGNADEALIYYDKALEVYPDFVLVHYNKANLLMNLSRNEEALYHYDKAIQIDRYCVDAYIEKAELLCKMEKYADALKVLDNILNIVEASDIRDRNEKICTLLKCKGEAFHIMGKFNEAIECYDKALAVDKDRADVLVKKGEAYNRLGMPQEAILMYEKALGVRNDYYIAYFLMGVTYKHLDEYQLALEAFDCYINAVPKVPEAYVERAEVLQFMQRYEEAKEDCDQALVLRPQFGSACYRKSLILCELGKYDEAIEILEKLLDDEEFCDIAGYFKGVVYNKISRIQRTLS